MATPITRSKTPGVRSLWTVAHAGLHSQKEQGLMLRQLKVRLSSVLTTYTCTKCHQAFSSLDEFLSHGC